MAAWLRIAVTGSSGLIGSALVDFLAGRGHRVVNLIRGQPRPGSREVLWDPDRGATDPAALEDLDAVVHLAGENIASRRWTAAQKERIRTSRVEGTRVLANALAALPRPPRVFACASAIGFYGSRGDAVLDEESAAGEGFLPQVCRQWEAAAQAAADRGIRVVAMRLGVVLSPRGGALAQMLRPFRFGLGGRVGDGRQYWSWISRRDVVGAIHHVIVTGSLVGPVNLVTPHPVTNREFTRTLAGVLRRPALLPMPAAVLRLVLGEMADELLLSSARVLPTRLVQSGYAFRHPTLEATLRDMLGSAPTASLPPAGSTPNG